MAVKEMYAVTPQWNTPALKEELEPTEIEFRNVGKCFPAKGKTEAPFAIRDVNFKIRRGEVVSIIGPSGCGKSTILNMGSGLYRPTEGEVFVGGEPVTGPVPQVAFMLQKIC